MRNLIWIGGLLTVIGCSDDSKGPTASDNDLVGSWEFVSSDMGVVVAENLESYLIDQGISRAVADSLTDELSADFEVRFNENFFVVLRFNSDGSYEDNTGDAGTWSVSGNRLTITDADGETDTFSYFADGDDLTLIFSHDDLLKEFREEFSTEEDQELFDAMFGEDDNVRFHFTRR